MKNDIYWWYHRKRFLWENEQGHKEQILVDFHVEFRYRTYHQTEDWMDEYD